jgi:hypothetical protein
MTLKMRWLAKGISLSQLKVRQRLIALSLGSKEACSGYTSQPLKKHRTHQTLCDADIQCGETLIPNTLHHGKSKYGEREVGGINTKEQQND